MLVGSAVWVVVTCFCSLATINALILRICVPRLLQCNDLQMANHVKAAQKWSNKYCYTCYLHNRDDFIKVCSVIRAQVFFHRLFAGGAANAAIGFQETALIPAEVENSDEEEQDWDRDKDPVDPFVRFSIWGNVFQYSQLILTVINFAVRLTNTIWTRFSCLLIRRWCCLRCS